MNRGYIKFWRKTFDSGMHRNHKMFVLWMWILGHASHKRHKQFVGNIEVELEPGQLVVGRKKLALELKMSEQTVRTILNRLKTAGNLTIKSTNRFSIVSIVNWDTYNGNGIENNQQVNQQLTSNQPATNHKQECKALKNEKNKKHLSQKCDENVYGNQEKPIKGNVPKAYHPDFETFWQAYPKRNGRKNGKMAAFKAWWIAVRDGLVTADAMLSRITVLAPTYGDYAKDAATWIRARGWEDEYDEQATTECQSKVDKALGVLKFDGVAEYKAFCAKNGLPVNIAAIADYTKGAGCELRRVQ